MGKESNLRKRGEEEQKEYISNGNGRRKEWDTGREIRNTDPEDAPPGCNTDIWNLAVYFRDKAAELGEDLREGLPVIYGFLQKALTRLSAPAILTRARTTGIQVHWVSIVERAIDEYANYEHSLDISSFYSPVKFEYYVQRSIDTLVWEKQRSTAKVVPQPDRPVLPSKRTAEQQKVHDIVNRKYTEEELRRRMKEFREQQKREEEE